VDHRRLPVLRRRPPDSVDRQLEASVGEQAREAEDAFCWVTHYEQGFWDMAMSR
jgi:thiaminase